eukprot:TRINITY_DN72512_c0_g1_i1.p1 TRINITY_DN72512_c0_g1~~TRINITY_DN72512_c0_g1_i1.p1  ORF type:complete len:451 (+),score=51.59 TRINITY_DN72512_c0_g1_i1:108-1460(+)
MKKILALLAIVSIALCMKPSIKTAIRNQVIVDLKNAVVPLIIKEFALIIMPDMKFHHSGFEVHISRIVATLLPFNPNQIVLQFVPGTNTLLVGGIGLIMGGGAHVHVKFKFISKTANMQIVVKNLGFACVVSMVSVADKPFIVVSKTKIHLAKKDISVRVHDQFFAFLIEIFKDYFLGFLVRDLESMLPKSLTKHLLKIIASLPTDISISDTLAMKYGFPYAPFYKEDYLYTGISGYVHPKKSPGPPPYEPSNIPEFNPKNPKRMQFFISEYVVKTALDSEFKTGAMVVNFEKELVGHHLKIQCKATKVPEIHLVNAIIADLDSECDVYIDHKEDYSFGVVTQSNVNVSETVKNNKILFNINGMEVVKIEFKKLPPYNIEWFKKIINELLKVAVEVVNKEMGEKGIPLPSIHVVEFKNTMEEVKNGYIEIGADPVFHLTQKDLRIIPISD